MKEIFKGLKVVELANVLAGPAVGMFFAELGAEVIKIENKTTNGDITRSYRLASEDHTRAYSAYYCSTNWNKTALLKNLNLDSEREEVLGIIQKADIVISNFKRSSATSLGLDYLSLSALNPKLIYGQIDSYGHGDERPAFDVLLQAETGFLHMTGEADRPPSKMPVALIDLIAAHQLKEGILIALLERTKTDKGCLVSVSLFDAAVASLANQASNWLMEGHNPTRMGNRHPNIAPYGDIFYTIDQKALILAVGTEKQFKSLVKSLHLENQLNIKKFESNQDRVQNRDELYEIIQMAISNFEYKDIIRILKNFNIPAGPLRSLKDLFALDEIKDLILTQREEDGEISQRVRTAVFKFEQ